MIRRAHKGDLVYLERMARLFVKESGYPFTHNDNKLREFIWSFLSDDDKAAFVLCDIFDTPRGMVAGLISTVYYSDDKIAQEVAWYVEPEYRGKIDSAKLLRAYEDWARSKGSNYVQVSSLCTPEVERYYERLGYTKTESAFLRKF